jgi:hypothetical protein
MYVFKWFLCELIVLITLKLGACEEGVIGLKTGCCAIEVALMFVLPLNLIMPAYRLSRILSCSRKFGLTLS